MRPGPPPTDSQRRQLRNLQQVRHERDLVVLVAEVVDDVEDVLVAVRGNVLQAVPKIFLDIGFKNVWT